MKKIIYCYSKNTKLLAFWAVIFVLLQGLSDIAQTIFLFSITGLLENQKSATFSVWHEYWVYLTLVLCFAIVSLIFGMLGSYLGSKSSLQAAKEIRHHAFLKICHYNFADMDKFGVASLLNRFTNDVTKIQTTIQMVLTMLIKAPILLVGSLVITFIIQPVIGYIAIGLILVIITGFFTIWTKVNPLVFKSQKVLDKTNKVLRENILGMQVVRSFQIEQEQDKRFNHFSHSLKHLYIKLWIYFALLIPFTACVIYVATSCIFLATNTQPSANGAQIYLCINLLWMILGAILIFSMVVINVLRSRASVKRIVEIFDTNPTILEKKKPIILDDDALDIEFSNVDFSYKKTPDNTYVLNDINLKIPQGKMIGIIGSTASGKSSLVQLITRLYDTTKGIITIGGHNIKDISLESLHQKIAIVLQDNFLFSGTIRSNMQLVDEKITDSEIMELAHIVCADDFISKQINGLSSTVDQRGRNFSGGQKQRLCILRSLIRHPKILILDDSTSALDMMTEAKFQHRIRKAMANTTLIVVAQRISSVKNADQIVVMDKGKIAAVGKHEDLAKNNKIYRSIILSQLGERGLNDVKN